MTTPLFNQIPQKSHELLVQYFIKNLMEFPGCYLEAPTPVRRRESEETTQAWNLIKETICLQTADMLTMMGINHKVGSDNQSIMIEDP